MEVVVEIVKSREDSGLLIKGGSETIENEATQKEGFLGLLIGTLGTSLLGNLLAGKAVNWAGEGTVRTGQEL